MAALVYKQFVLARTVFCVLLCVLALIPSAQAQTNPVYTIEGVEVDVTAKNAVQAREKALMEAQVKAYGMLAERLLGEEAAKSFKMPPADNISLLVQDFEVTNEQLSAVRYKGTYTIRFRPNAMKSQMAAQGQSYSDTQKKPVLVLPFLQADGGSVLWREGNPWMAAWRALPSDKSMMQPTALPLGDAFDVAQIGDADIARYDPVRMQQLAARYNADDVAIVIAEPQSTPAGKRLSLSLLKHGFNGPEPVQKITLDATPGETDDALYARAAQQVRGLLRQDWKANAAYNPRNPPPAPSTAAPLPYTRQTVGGPAANYVAIARFASVQDWVRLKSTLERTGGMQGVMVKALKPREALLDIRFAGNLQQMQAALQGAGILMRATTATAPVEIYLGNAQPLYPR